MDREENETIVIFRRWPRRDSGGVLALFPEEPGTYDDWTCSSYSHVGQHGSADPVLCMRATKPARPTDPDVIELRRELEGLGYNLVVRFRLRASMRDVRRKALAHCA